MSNLNSTRAKTKDCSVVLNRLDVSQIDQSISRDLSLRLSISKNQTVQDQTSSRPMTRSRNASLINGMHI